MYGLAEYGYVAGIIDGEGHIRLTKQGGRVAVKMTDQDVIRKCRDIMGVGTVSGPHLLASGKPAWTWSVSRQADVASLLMTVYPLLGVRRQERIREVLAVWRDRPLYVPSGSPCGTYSGYAKHYRLGGKPCVPCVQARLEHQRDYRARQAA